MTKLKKVNISINGYQKQKQAIKKKLLYYIF